MTLATVAPYDDGLIEERRGRAVVVDWYLKRLFRRAHDDGRLSDVGFRVFSLQQPPSVLFRPQIVWRVLGPRRAVVQRQTEESTNDKRRRQLEEEPVGPAVTRLTHVQRAT